MADKTITGYAVRFNEVATIAGSFREQIDPAAFTKSLRDNDIVALLNHDSGRVLGRTSAGTLRLSADRVGLRFELDADPSTPSGQEALGTVGRRDVKGCSFAGIWLAETWEDGGDRLPLRIVTEIDLHEITLTAFPAYATTSASVRAVGEPSASRASLRAKMKMDVALRQRGLRV